jgi:pimeloyl-ACP methyl ester carboxylesterase
VNASGPQEKEGVLIVHGYPGSSRDWKDVIAPVKEFHERWVGTLTGYRTAPLE